MQDNRIKVIVIAGATCSGKTNLSLALAHHFDIEVISADSRQIFKYMDIGTAKPTKEELNSVKHHFIDYKFPDEYYSAGLFGKEALTTIQGIQNSTSVICGGSGLYIDALLNGIGKEEGEEEIPAARAEITEMIKEKGIDYAVNILKEVDPESAELYTDKNPRRIIRALEYYYTFNKKFSDNTVNPDNSLILKPYSIYVHKEREHLYQDINLRSKIMWENGLIEETQDLLKRGYSESLNALNTVGYKETIKFLSGSMSSAEALDKLSQTTRNYAKRQVTWFKRNKFDYVYEQNRPNSLENLIVNVKNFLNS